MSKFIATFFYVGLLRPGPGTWGSAAAIPFAWGVHWAFGFYGFLAAAVLVLVIGWWATAAYTRGADDHDPSEVVIDEVAGMFVTLLPLSFGLWHAGAAAHVFPWPGWVAGFLLFRLFDVWKPWIIGRLDRNGGMAGVMLDDVVAGFFAALVMAGMAAFSHLVLMA